MGDSTATTGLLPCPFCGGPARISVHGEIGTWVECVNKCPVKPFVDRKIEKEAVTAWNTRSETTGLPADDARALADDLHEFIAAAPHDYPGHIVELFERCEAALRRTAPVAGRDREVINAGELAQFIENAHRNSKPSVIGLDRVMVAFEIYKRADIIKKATDCWATEPRKDRFLECADAILALSQPAETPERQPVALPLAVRLRDEEGPPLPQMIAQRRAIEFERAVTAAEGGAAHARYRVSQALARANEFLSTLPAPVPAGMWEALEKIIEIDQHESKITVECDSAGNTYEIRSLDGPCATLARALLAALALPAERVE